MAAFRCDHPRTPENTAPNGANGTCRTCKNARLRERYAANLEKSRAANRERMQKHRGGLKGNANARKDTCPQGHPYDEENTYVYKGTRRCKACNLQRNRDTYACMPEVYAQKRLAWYTANRETAITASKRWAQANPERANLNSRLKKQRRRAAGVLTAAEWNEIKARYNHRCLACGSSASLTIDHVVPISKGGLNTMVNVQPLCGTCNSSKATKTIDYRPATAVI
jgi:5-methylcytosine-specific restriction endonuclease McrA